ncbi:hypothetical protein [Stigmatella erecta]|uniref:Tetratricopeptide repeat-containing protein n=1 Tax=Stigmatella erecta TaxID=83460 RepID=A0A1I0IGC8_9BACT|nr:hypothetical protein [Stigmatella erecta]SET95924.1 hypothetical protein SAMN05443639_10641 [Stigmatella erecta]
MSGTMRRGQFRFLVLLLCTSLWAVPALAQKPAPSLSNRPAWAQNVSPEQQKAAAELLEQGNNLLKDSIFIEAEKKYVEALKHWKHPAIYYNLALALLNLARPAEVYEYMVASTQYGEAPLGEERFKHARRYIEHVEKESAWANITCASSITATLKRDGELLPLHCERFERMLRPGAYTISAFREGNPVPDTVLTLAAGERAHYRLEVEDGRRWAAWKPWTVLGAGVAMAVGGRIIHMNARDEYRAFDEGVLRCNAQNEDLRQGCAVSPELGSVRSKANTLQWVAMGAFAAGGAALITGGVMLYKNRLHPQTQLVPLQGKRLSVAPVMGKGERGVSASLQF